MKCRILSVLKEMASGCGDTHTHTHTAVRQTLLLSLSLLAQVSKLYWQTARGREALLGKEKYHWKLCDHTVVSRCWSVYICLFLTGNGGVSWCKSCISIFNFSSVCRCVCVCVCVWQLHPIKLWAALKLWWRVRSCTLVGMYICSVCVCVCAFQGNM